MVDGKADRKENVLKNAPHTALDLAERITVLHYGSVIVEGTRSEVVADPKTREVYFGN